MRKTSLLAVIGPPRLSAEIISLSPSRCDQSAMRGRSDSKGRALFRMVVGQGTQNNGIDHTEHGRHNSDSKGQHHNGSHGKAWTPAQLCKSVAKILSQPADALVSCTSFFGSSTAAYLTIIEEDFSQLMFHKLGIVCDHTHKFLLRLPQFRKQHRDSFAVVGIEIADGFRAKDVLHFQLDCHRSPHRRTLNTCSSRRHSWMNSSGAAVLNSNNSK